MRFTKHYGTQKEYWQGVDLSTSLRLGGGALVQGGVSWGQQVIDNCEIAGQGAGSDDADRQPDRSDRHDQRPARRRRSAIRRSRSLRRSKALGTYTIPRIDVQVSGTFQSVPGPQLVGHVHRSAGGSRLAWAGIFSSGNTVDVNIVKPGSIYGDRLFQTDFRVGKVFRFAGNRRATVGVDLFNLFNGNAVLTQQNTYSVTNPTLWGTPQAVQQARLLKFSLSLAY